MKNIIEKIKEEFGVDISNKNKNKQQYWINKFRKVQGRKSEKHFKQLINGTFHRLPLFMG